MDFVKCIDFLRKNMKTLKKVFIAYLSILVIFDMFLPRDEAHAHYWIDKVYVFWTVFGAVGCSLLIKIGKDIAHLFLSKDEDYYG